MLSNLRLTFHNAVDLQTMILTTAFLQDPHSFDECQSMWCDERENVVRGGLLMEARAHTLKFLKTHKKCEIISLPFLGLTI